MTGIEEYFLYVRQLFQSLTEAHAEQYEEQLLTSTRGNLRIRLLFSDHALLEISEAIVLRGEIQGVCRKLRKNSASQYFDPTAPV